MALLSFMCCTATFSYAQIRSLPETYILPEVPDSIVSPEQRADYIALHYWDNFDFADSSLISLGDYAEQAFVDFIGLLPYVRNTSQAVDMLYSRAAYNRDMFYYFVYLGDKYLYERDSPMYDEGVYILVLQSIIHNRSLEESDKSVPRHRLKQILKNRVGDAASDFVYLCRDGSNGRLSDIDARYTLIYFNAPDCSDCHRVKALLTASKVINDLIDCGSVALLSVCVEGVSPEWESCEYPENWIDAVDDTRTITDMSLYVLRSLPAIYLLDKNKRVILKDVSVREIEAWFSRIKAEANSEDVR